MKVFLGVGLLFLFTCAAVWGQATAQIHGTVQDSSGSAVPGAEIKATQTETGASRAVNSGPDGGYVLVNLPVGPYQLEVTKEGFTKYVQSGIVLQVNSDPAIDPTLKIGTVSEQVLVEANATAVETRSSGVGEVVQTQRILELPLNGRNVTDLITMAGTAVQVGVTRSSWFNNLPEISIAGQSYFGTGYSLDGANHLDYLTGTILPVAFPDATQEFKVESSGQSAQRGLATSVSIVTRSGSNDLHGDLFEFMRNDGFGSAREYFSTTSSTLKRNQFGGTVGGPIKKNKLFYFGGFQSTILHSSPGNTTTVFPTAQMLAGNWTTFAACNHETLKAPFVNNQISPSSYSAPSLFIVNKILPTLGTTPDQCGNITYSTPSFEDDYQYVGKIDYQLNDKQSLFFRALDTYEHIPSSQTLTSNILAATAGQTNDLAQSYSIGHTYVISPTLVNSFRVGVDRTATTGSPINAFSFCDAGVNIWCGSSPHQIGSNGLVISQGFTYSTTANSVSYWRMTSYGVNDDISWIKGAHQMTLGAGGLVGRYGELNDFAGSGQFTFSGTSSGSGMADFFLGIPSTFFQGLPNTASTRQNSVNIYFTDSWRINSHLTFNYGIRWEPFLPQTVANGYISDFDMNRFLAGTKSTVYVNAPPGFYFPGDPGFPDKSATYSHWDHFDPRGGIAWDPKGDGKTSVRAAYSFGYAYIPGITREDQAGSNPFSGRANYTPGPFANPYANTPGGNPYPYTLGPNVIFTPGGQFLATPYNLPTPTTYSWNVSLQHQFGTSWVVSATYIGSRVQHLYVNVPINYAPVVGPIVASPAQCAPTASNCTLSAAPGNVQARRILTQLNPAAGALVGNMDAWSPAGYQNYNAGLFSLQKRFSKGVSMSANWTWSHCIGIYQGFNSKPEETETVPNNPTFDRGNCDSDRRNIVNITAVTQTPRFSNNVLRLIGTGWQLAGIYRFTSGTPLSIQEGSGQDRELAGINHERPNLVIAGSPYTGHDGPSVPYLNINAFAQPAFGTVGNLGWNSIVSPTYWDLDLALSRQFPITDRQKIELRADAFNLTNSFVTQVLGVNATGPNIGTQTISPAVPAYDGLTGGALFSLNNGYAQPTRKIQFALKYTF